MHSPSRSPARLLAPVLLLLALGGCADYNTFYLAKKYYGEAQKAQERATNDQPAPEAMSKYDATLRQCAKLLADYPKSKYVDDAAYMQGRACTARGSMRRRSGGSRSSWRSIPRVRTWPMPASPRGWRTTG
jgi:hypothetical protein